MKLNEIKYLPESNAVAKVIGDATGVPFVGEMMVAAAGQESELTPDPEPQYILQSLIVAADCDEDAGCYVPLVQCTILSKEEMTDEEITYGWTFDDGEEVQTFPNEENLDNFLGYGEGYLITNENYSSFEVDEQYIGWYWTLYNNENAELFMGEEGQEATYTIYVNGNSIGSRDKESVTPECDAKCE